MVALAIPCMGWPSLVSAAPAAQGSGLQYSIPIVNGIVFSWSLLRGVAPGGGDALNMSASWTQPFSTPLTWFGVALASSPLMSPGDSLAIVPGSPDVASLMDPNSGNPAPFSERLLLNGYSFCNRVSEFPTCVSDSGLDIPDNTLLSQPYFRFEVGPANQSWTMSGGFLRRAVLSNTSATFLQPVGADGTLVSPLLTDLGATSVPASGVAWITAAWGYPIDHSAVTFHTTAMSGAVHVNLATGEQVVDLPAGAVAAHVIAAVIAFALAAPIASGGAAGALAGSRCSSPSRTALTCAAKCDALSGLAAVATLAAGLAVVSGSLPSGGAHFASVHGSIGVAAIVAAALLAALFATGGYASAASRKVRSSAWVVVELARAALRVLTASLGLAAAVSGFAAAGGLVLAPEALAAVFVGFAVTSATAAAGIAATMRRGTGAGKLLSSQPAASSRELEMSAYATTAVHPKARSLDAAPVLEQSPSVSRLLGTALNGSQRGKAVPVAARHFAGANIVASRIPVSRNLTSFITGGVAKNSDRSIVM